MLKLKPVRANIRNVGETLALCLCFHNRQQVDILFLILYLTTLYCCNSPVSSTGSLQFHCVFVDRAFLPCIPIGLVEPVVSSASHKLYNTETLRRQEHSDRKEKKSFFKIQIATCQSCRNLSMYCCRFYEMISVVGK